MNVVLLGSGKVMRTFYKEVANRHNVIGVCDYYNKNAPWVLGANCLNGAAILENHYDVRHLNEIDCILMMNYGALIEEYLLEEYLFINIHFTLLPKYRGYHGFFWSMINGEGEMGYSVFKVDKGIDTGPVYYQKKFNIGITQDINEVRNKFEDHICSVISDVLVSIENGLMPVNQKDGEAFFVTKRSPEDGLIDWGAKSVVIINLIRALAYPATPGAFFIYNSEKYFVRKASFLSLKPYIERPGRVLNIDKTKGSIIVKTLDTAIEIERIAVGDNEVNASDIIKRVGVSLANR